MPNHFCPSNPCPMCNPQPIPLIQPPAQVNYFHACGSFNNGRCNCFGENWTVVEEGEICDDCGRRYTDVYWLDQDLWDVLHERSPAGLLCPSCAVRRALAAYPSEVSNGM